VSYQLLRGVKLLPKNIYKSVKKPIINEKQTRFIDILLKTKTLDKRAIYNHKLVFVKNSVLELLHLVLN
jgi:hypothetical protein